MGKLVSRTLGTHEATITDGGVEPGAHVADPAALTSAAASGGDAPTEAEYNNLRADLVSVRTQLIALITSLENAGLLA